MTPKTICVLGGTGFVGHQLISRLNKAGYFVVVPSRNRERQRSLQVLPRVDVVDADIHDEETLKALFVGCHAVVNLVAILNENKRGDFKRVHIELPQKIVGACKESGVKRLLHMSALNADSQNGSSTYLRSKGEGEDLVHRSALAVTTFRPSVIFGRDDHFFNKFAGLLSALPVLPLTCPDSKMAPVYVGDVVEIIIKSLNDKTTFGQRFDMCGPEVFTLRQLVEYTARITGLHRTIIPLGDGISAAMGRALGILPGKKPFTYDNYLSLKTPAICKSTPLPEQFGLRATTIDSVVPQYIGRSDIRGRYDDMRQHAARDEES